MNKLTKEQEQQRDEYLAKMIDSKKLTKEAIERIMSDPVKCRIINAMFAS